MIKVTSFGYKYGPPPIADAVLDCRDLLNPHSHQILGKLDGRHKMVQTYVCQNRYAETIMSTAMKRVEEAGARSIAFGCTGGRHRSVAVAEMFAEMLRIRNFAVEVEHVQLSAQNL